MVKQNFKLDDIKYIRKEVIDTGEDVDEIKEDIDDIKKEVLDSGEDIDEIKEDIEDIKEGFETLQKDKSLVSKIRSSLPERFGSDDLAQQIVGATILSAPFVVTEEVWSLAKNLDVWHIGAIFLVTLIFDILLFYYTKFQNMKKRNVVRFIPLRIISILLVTYITSTVMLVILGVIGGAVNDVGWAIRLIFFVGLFANIGAGTADLLK